MHQSREIDIKFLKAKFTDAGGVFGIKLA